jgi:hypothetical protein
MTTRMYMQQELDALMSRLSVAVNAAYSSVLPHRHVRLMYGEQLSLLQNAVQMYWSAPTKEATL